LAPDGSVAFFLFRHTHRSPTASRIRAKILYATSKQGLRRLLDGVHYEVQATDPSEMGFDVIRGRAQ
jgi:cofilin